MSAVADEDLLCCLVARGAVALTPPGRAEKARRQDTVRKGICY